jgi:heme/copper-type cytochrome/quinol oxidase subunit 3
MARAVHKQPVAAPVSRRLVAVRPAGGGPPPARVWQPPISNGQLAILILIAFETMIFLGLFVSYWVLESNSFGWPPPDMPRLPLAVTWVNTAMLLFSAWTMSRAVAAVRAGSSAGLRAALVATAVLGVGFLAVQGSEWVSLVRQGLTLSSGSYGSIFYTLIGLHGLHVVGAVVWLLAVLGIAQRRGFIHKQHGGVTLCAMYWYFVCALWVVVFGIVYLD